MFSYVPSNCAQQFFPSKGFDSEHNVFRDSIPPSPKTGLETIETEKDKRPEIQGFFVSDRGAISVLTPRFRIVSMTSGRFFFNCCSKHNN